MDDKQITDDRQRRVTEAKKEIEVILKKYELDLIAEGMLGDTIKIEVMMQFKDVKKYPSSKLAQEVGKIINTKDLIDNEKGDKI